MLISTAEKPKSSEINLIALNESPMDRIEDGRLNLEGVENGDLVGAFQVIGNDYLKHYTADPIDAKILKDSLNQLHQRDAQFGAEPARPLRRSVFVPIGYKEDPKQLERAKLLIESSKENDTSELILYANYPNDLSEESIQEFTNTIDNLAAQNDQG